METRNEKMRSGPNLLKWSNIVAFAAVVLVNGVAGGTTIIGGRNTADVSNTYSTLITPAGYTFAIWGVIYVLLGVYVVYQALPRSKSQAFQQRVGWLFVLGCLFNVLWIFAWQNEFMSLSVLLIFLLLASLILIYLRLDVGRSKVDRAQRLAVHLPFSVYLGWITIASIADVAAALVSANWNGFGISPETWAIGIILIALLIASLVAYIRKDIAYELVVVWAFLGIAVNQGAFQAIQISLLASVVVVVIVLTVSIFHGTRMSKRAR
ncbi:MAG TPA: hypothetical protein VMB46_04240 [Methanomassiliicoccales archaeon]|nr:hypothetical protein [Methanomassiliicoccales archaeon]